MEKKNNKGSLKHKVAESFYDRYDNIIGSISFEAYDVALRQVMREVYEAGFMQGVRQGPPSIILLEPVATVPDIRNTAEKDKPRDMGGK